MSKQKYLKLSSFLKEEYPKGEVVGENISIGIQNVEKPTTPPVGHPSFGKEGSQIPSLGFDTISSFAAGGYPPPRK